MESPQTKHYALLLIIVFFVIASLQFTAAEDWYISPSGNDDTGNGNEYNPFQTLTKAVNVCSSGDTIVALPGNYGASNTTINKSLSIRSQQVGDPSSTKFFNTSLLFEAGANISISGVWFTESPSSALGGCGGYVNVSNCNFEVNQIGINASCGSVWTVKDSFFCCNVLQHMVVGSASVFVSNCTIVTNGGITVGPNGTLTVIDSKFESTFNDNGGGALSINGGVVIVNNTQFQLCESSANGGAALVSSKGVLILQNSLLINNLAAYGSGGGVFIETGGMMYAFRSNFIDNYAKTGSGGAYACDGTGRVTTVDCIFNGNYPDVSVNCIDIIDD